MRYFSEYFVQKITSRLQITFFSLKSCSNLCHATIPRNTCSSFRWHTLLTHITFYCIAYTFHSRNYYKQFFLFFVFCRSCRSSGVAKDQLAWCEHGGRCCSRGDREKDGRLQWCWYHQCLQVRVEETIWAMIREFEFHVAQEFWCLAYCAVFHVDLQNAQI